MTDAPGTPFDASFEADEADRLEQTLEAERPEVAEHDDEAPAHLRDRSAESSLEADPTDLEEQELEVDLREPEDDEA
ncbi:hypothetical protein MRU69_12005 [Kocuria flava]|uniref:hypothetical protein n=1 Tax=Kocuria flava TaxID=446860 RepID=UPI001FF6907E|nr:hypothetical protein [Kocuria flava]MCJ8505572.1 hypothetical protein [Kocuria flava]